MDLNDTPEQAAYREKARSWLEANRDQAPPRSGSSEDTAYIDARRAWQRKLAEAGLAGVTWPREFGGQGLGPIEQVTVNQEISRADVPGILDVIGIGMLGPCLIAHGTEEQKSRHLGPMLHGDEVWCQMFSEPAAGSDLAAIQTRARQGDDGSWTLNGQKVWTTNAQFASFGLLLARTDPDVPKHKGLTMFIVPMDAEGVTVRGLRQISGEAEFNEVFFDDVVLDEDAVVGGVGNGWGTALTVLMFERLTIGFGSESFGSPARLAETIAADPDARGDSDMRQRLGEVIPELLAVRFNGYRALTALSRGPDPRPRGRPRQGDDGQRRDRRHRPRRRRGRPRRARRRQRVELPDLVPARAEVGRRHRADPAQHDRRARARAAARAAARQGRAVQRAARQGEGGGGAMNFALSDEQMLLREAARGALSRHKTVEAAREALEDPGALPDLWPMAVEAGWPGLLIDEEHGGAGLDAFDAMLVAEECGRVLAPVPLLGLLPATAILNAAGDESLADGRRRRAPAGVRARPPAERPRAALDGRAALGRRARARAGGDRGRRRGGARRRRGVRARRRRRRPAGRRRRDRRRRRRSAVAVGAGRRRGRDRDRACATTPRGRWVT